MMISPLGAVGAPSPVLPASGLPAVPGALAASSTPDDGGFAGVLGAIDGLQRLQDTSQTLAVEAVTGDLDDVHDYTIAAAEASLALELTVAVRNKAIDAFTEIMRMQA